ncbi:MAG: response regulator [Vicinamibacterales bacterium]
MPAHILIVDDQEDVLNTLVRFLTVSGYQPVGLLDFREAKDYIDQTPPDVLVTDVRLGSYNGLQLAIHLRAARANAGIVVLSAWDDPNLRQEAAAVGATYELKPLTKEQLVKAVTSVLPSAA